MRLVTVLPPLVPRRLLVIANPISGGGRGRVLVPELCAELRRRSIEAEPYFTTAAGDAAARAQRAGAEAWDGIIACGGDGTVAEVCNGMPDLSRPLGMLPLGSANVLAKELGLPRRPAELATLLAAGTRRQVAVGRCDGRRFLLFCGIGVDGAVVQRVSEVRTGTLGKWKYTGPILHTLRRWPQFTLGAEFADGSRLSGLSSILVTRVRNYGGVLRLTPDVGVDSGLLHVLCFTTRSRVGWLWQGCKALLRGLREGPALTVRQTTSVRIDGEAPFQIDGDYGGMTPIAIDLEPGCATLFAPLPRA